MSPSLDDILKKLAPSKGMKNRAILLQMTKTFVGMFCPDGKIKYGPISVDVIPRAEQWLSQQSDDCIEKVLSEIRRLLETEKK